VTIDSVDKFVKTKVPRERRATVAAIRARMGEIAPRAAETFSYMMPVWKVGGIVAYLTASKRDVTLGFVGGDRFEDRYGLLKGGGKSTRHLKFKAPEDVKTTVLSYYVKQALKHDRERAN
jgi:hypothetical protein